MINGLRLKQVRELMGLTQSELALNLDVSQSLIAYIEGGYFQPAEEILQRICEYTHFPQSFFEQIEVTEFPYGSLLYRSRTSVDALEKSQANRYGQFMYEIAEKLVSKLNYRQFKFPKGRVDASIAARITRSNLGYTSDLPIDDLIYDLERNGVFIFNSPVHFNKVDAFAVWAGYDNKMPVIILTGVSPADRLRYSVAHELGHLILHSTLFGDIQEFEREADVFASELLMPEETMRRVIVEPFSLAKAIRLRSEWKVSIQALVRRAHDLHIISGATYKSLYVQMSQQKKKLQERFSLDVPEQPRGLRSMAETVYGKKINYQQFSKDTKFPISLLKQIIEAQASEEEYTRRRESTNQELSTHKAKILDFPGNKDRDIAKNTNLKQN